MKIKLIIGVLVVACVGLGVAYYLHQQRAAKEQRQAEETITTFSNQVVSTTADLRRQQDIATVLETNLNRRMEELAKRSNDLATLQANLAKSETDAKAAADLAKAEITKRDQKINELESQRDDLTRRMTELNTAISEKERMITEVERKLAASEGDREFLLKELKRLNAEKVDLERQFASLQELRAQVTRLKDELNISRRLEFIRMGLFGPDKGAEKLKQMDQTSAGKTNFDLNVEIRQDGSATIKKATNAPANPPPPK